MDSEIDQLCKICKILGVPDLNIFPEGTNTSRLLSVFCYEEVSFVWNVVQFFVCLTLLSLSFIDNQFFCVDFACKPC